MKNGQGGVKGIGQDDERARDIERGPCRLEAVVHVAQDWGHQHLAERVDGDHNAVHVNEGAFVKLIFLHCGWQELEVERGLTELRCRL